MSSTPTEGAPAHGAGDSLLIQPLTAPVDAEVLVPGSRSLTNRAMLIAAMAAGRSVLRGALFSEDTEVMAGALNTLGLLVEPDPPEDTFTVWGNDGEIPAREAELFVANAGTAMRFLTAYVSLGHGRYRLDGVPRMRERPIQPLLDSLAALGVRAVSERGNGCPPVIVEADGLSGGRVRMRGDLSSQYFSALLLVGPLTAQGIEIETEGELVSRPYIDLTADVMARFGATMRHEAYRRMIVPGGQRYRATDYDVEPDASNASYFFAAAAITGGRVRVRHLRRDSAQVDIGFLDVLEAMGCAVTPVEDGLEVRGPERLRGLEVDMSAISDMAQTLAAIAPFAGEPVTIRNVAHARLQECDRVTAMATELARMGVRVEEFPDGLRIHPGRPQPAEIETYNDHRMAMSFALVGLAVPGIRIRNPVCVRKTFPDYFKRLETLRKPGGSAADH
jgi:3-phosphoshikimate 1-carboxyvinyltransferase